MAGGPRAASPATAEARCALPAARLPGLAPRYRRPGPPEMAGHAGHGPTRVWPRPWQADSCCNARPRQAGGVAATAAFVVLVAFVAFVVFVALALLVAFVAFVPLAVWLSTLAGTPAGPGTSDAMHV